MDSRMVDRDHARTQSSLDVEERGGRPHISDTKLCMKERPVMCSHILTSRCMQYVINKDIHDNCTNSHLWCDLAA